MHSSRAMCLGLIVACIALLSLIAHAQPGAPFRVHEILDFARVRPGAQHIPDVAEVRDIVRAEFARALADFDNDGVDEMLYRGLTPDLCHESRCRTVVIKGRILPNGCADCEVLLIADLPLWLGMTRETSNSMRYLVELVPGKREIVVEDGRQRAYEIRSTAAASQVLSRPLQYRAAGTSDQRRLFGIYLGMTLDEARRTAGSLGVVKESVSSVEVLGAASYVSQFSVGQESSGVRRQFTVNFTPPPEPSRVFAVTSHVWAPAAAGTMDGVVQQLVDRYGKPSSSQRSSSLAIYEWIWRTNRNVPSQVDSSRCEVLSSPLAARGADMAVGPGTTPRDLQELLNQADYADCDLFVRATVRADYTSIALVDVRAVRMSLAATELAVAPRARQ